MGSTVRMLMLISLLLVGCGGTDGVTLVPVTGFVAYKSKPVEGAEVVFTGEKSPRAGRGVTDGEGKFQLTTYRPNDGAVPGKHTVTITKIDSSSIPPPNSIPLSDDPETLTKLSADAVSEGKSFGEVAGGGPKHLIPEKYSDPKRSQLKADVSVGGTNEFTFQLID